MFPASYWPKAYWPAAYWPAPVDAGAPTFAFDPATDEYLGRAQVGSNVSLLLAPYNGNGTPMLPASAPLAWIYTEAEAFVESVAMPLLSTRHAILGRRLLLSGSYSAGRYVVIYQWFISSVAFQRTSYFDVFDNGDQEGSVLAMKHAPMPTGQHALMQTEKGSLTAGRRPR